jgi:hypothetical protein
MNRCQPHMRYNSALRYGLVPDGPIFFGSATEHQEKYSSRGADMQSLRGTLPMRGLSTLGPLRKARQLPPCARNALKPYEKSYWPRYASG